MLRVKQNKIKYHGVTFVEMLFVLLIMSLLAYFLYTLFSKAVKISSTSTEFIDIYEQQVNFNRVLKQDIASSFMFSKKNKAILDELKANGADAISAGLSSVDLSKGNYFAFVVKKKDPLLDKDMAWQDSGIYMVVYFWDDLAGLKRKLLSPQLPVVNNGSVNFKWDNQFSYNKDIVLINKDGRDIGDKFTVDKFDFDLSLVNKKFIVSFDVGYEGKKQRFKHVFKWHTDDADDTDLHRLNINIKK